MGRVNYKGYDLPDGLAIPDVPDDLRTLVDSGPIPRFTNAAARSAALTSPSEGMVCFTADTSTLWIYRTGGWRLLAPKRIAPFALFASVESFTPTTLTTIAENNNIGTLPVEFYMMVQAFAQIGGAPGAVNVFLQAQDQDGDGITPAGWAGTEYHERIEGTGVDRTMVCSGLKLDYAAGATAGFRIAARVDTTNAPFISVQAFAWLYPHADV